jgi:hypothetical protein
MADVSGKSWGRGARAEGPSVAQPTRIVKEEAPTALDRQFLYTEVFCAALTGLLANRSLTAEDVVRMAGDVAELSVAKIQRT